MENLILNPSKSFLALKKVNPRILRTFERSFSRDKNRKSAEPSSPIIHSLEGEYIYYSPR